MTTRSSPTIPLSSSTKKEPMQTRASRCMGSQVQTLIHADFSELHTILIGVVGIGT